MRYNHLDAITVFKLDHWQRRTKPKMKCRYILFTRNAHLHFCALRSGFCFFPYTNEDHFAEFQCVGWRSSRLINLHEVDLVGICVCVCVFAFALTKEEPMDPYIMGIYRHAAPFRVNHLSCLYWVCLLMGEHQTKTHPRKTEHIRDCVPLVLW